MKTYVIFSNQKEDYVAVKQGWSWPGFFFDIIWALVKKMWILGIGLIGLFVLLGVIEVIVEHSFNKEVASFIDVFTSCLGLTLSILFGINGNKWRMEKLISYGYDYQNTITAENPEAAINIWLKTTTNS